MSVSGGHEIGTNVAKIRLSGGLKGATSLNIRKPPLPSYGSDY